MHADVGIGRFRIPEECRPVTFGKCLTCGGGTFVEELDDLPLRDSPGDLPSCKVFGSHGLNLTKFYRYSCATCPNDVGNVVRVDGKEFGMLRLKQRVRTTA